MDAQVTVSRISEDDVKQRQIIVEIDRRPFATLMFGETASRAIPAGRHTLRVDNTWNKRKLDFEVAPGEHARFRTVSRAGRFTAMLALLGAGPMYVAIDRES